MKNKLHWTIPDPLVSLLRGLYGPHHVNILTLVLSRTLWYPSPGVFMVPTMLIYLH